MFHRTVDMNGTSIYMKLAYILWYCKTLGGKKQEKKKEKKELHPINVSEG